MQTKILVARVLAATALLCALSSGATAETSPIQPSLVSFKSRMPTIRAELSEITRSAEAAALRTLEHPKALLNVPYDPQVSFAREFTNRAGGFARTVPSEWDGQRPTENDIVLFSVRSWEKDGVLAQKYLREYKDKGWMTILFASKAGKPSGLDVDYFVDNGASGPAEQEAQTWIF